MSPLALVATIALAGAPSDVAKAAKAFDAGQKLYRQGNFADALAKFEESYKYKPHPVIVFNIGKCHERLGDLPRAMRSYRDYLRLAPEAKDRNQVTEAIARLERQFKDQGIQQLLVYTDPPGAEVFVDDKDLGAAPVSIEIPPGDHHVSIALPGFEIAQRTFSMPVNRSLELSFGLKPEAPPTPVLAPPTVTAVPAAALVLEQPPPPPPSPRRWTWVATAAAALAGGTGVGLGVASRSASADLRGSIHSGDQAQSLANHAVGFATGANVAYASSATAAVAAVALYFLEPGSRGGGRTSPGSGGGDF